MGSFWQYSYYFAKSSSKKHKATQKQELLYNKCKSCGQVCRGVVYKWRNFGWIWRCPHCLNGQRYPR